jgi:cell division control protein 6
MVGSLSYGAAYETKVQQQIKTVFSNFMSSESLFKDRNVLSPTWEPSQILHRDSEAMQLSTLLAPVLKGYKPNNVFVFGGVGTGKTITTVSVLKELNRTAKATKRPVKAVYINCKMKRSSDTEYRILAKLLKEFGEDVPETGLATASLYDRFFAAVKDKHVIICLDEIDALVSKIGDTFLYNLTRSEHTLSIIGITNNLSFSDSIDTRVKSSLCEEEIIFKPYNALQLKDILMSRISQAFNVPVDEVIVSKIAALAAQEHGDARRALELLRVAAECAERNGEGIVAESHVDMAVEKVDNDRVTESIKGQPKQSQAVLASIFAVKEAKEKSNGGSWTDPRVLSTDTYAAYKKLCEKAGLKVLTQRRISDLIGEFETFGIIDTRVISRGRHGRTREIIIQLNEQMQLKARKILAEAGF